MWRISIYIPLLVSYILHCDADIWRISNKELLGHWNPIQGNGSCILNGTNETAKFVHVPKTGGESVDFSIGQKKNHYTLRERINCYGDEGPFFSIVRNPYDRVWSWFKFCVHGFRGQVPGPVRFTLCDMVDAYAKKHHKEFDEEDAKMFFNSWVLKSAYISEQAISNASTSDFCHSDVMREFRFWVWGTFSDYLKDDTGRPLVDFVIRFEDFYSGDNFYRLLCEVGFGNIVEQHRNDDSVLLLSRNPTFSAILLNASFIDWYDSVSRDVVHKHYAADFLWLNYRWPG